MGQANSYIFLPKLGALYSGGVDDSSEMPFTTQYLASYEKSKGPSILELNAAVGELTPEQRSYVAQNMKKQHSYVYKMTDAAPHILQAMKAELKLNHLKKKSLGAGRMDVSVMQAMNEAYKEMRAAVNADNTNQLTIVQFVNAIQGKITNVSYVASAFTKISLDKLRGKIPEMGFPNVSVQVKRFSEPEITHTEFGQSEFRIFRNDIHLYISREDRMEATIDPYAVSTSQGQLQMMQARELLALKELSTLSVPAGYGVIPDMAAAATNPTVPRDKNDAPFAFTNVMVSHFKRYRNLLKYFIWNPLDYRVYLANWFTHAYTQIQIPEGFGVVPFFGLQKYGAIAIVSPWVPRGFVYSLTEEGAFELDGPKIIDQEYDAKKFADYTPIHDFIGYKIMNPKRYGAKLELEGITPETEYTTDAQISKALKAPKDLVVKNPDA